MKVLRFVSEPRLKLSHPHPLFIKDSYCRECGEPAREVYESQFYVCEYCQTNITDEQKFCHNCGAAVTEISTDAEKEKYVFLGVPLTKTEYEQTRSAMAGKEYVLKKEGISWRIDFVK